MVEHSFSFVVEARPEEIWPMSWQRRFISRDNDRLIQAAIERRVAAQRRGQAS